MSVEQIDAFISNEFLVIPKKKLQHQLINVQFTDAIPDHVMMMISNMPEALQGFAMDTIKKMLQKGEITVIKWPSQPDVQIQNDKNKIYMNTNIIKITQ